jgi:hypothetical protein
MALVTTFATIPLVSALYPGWYQASKDRSDASGTDMLMRRLANTEEVGSVEVWRNRLDSGQIIERRQRQPGRRC